MSVSYLIAFTDEELTAIYNAIENAPSDASYEAAYESVLEKITPARIGGPPAGARARA